MPFTIVRQDITRMKVDAVVNAANTELRMGGGVCGAIFQAAGPSGLQEACNKKAPIQTSEAVITPGFDLPARFIIHTAGPVYRPEERLQCEALLRSAYGESLRLALENGCTSIAFPLISSGIYGYPKEEALKVATTVIKEFLAEHDMDVYLAIFDRKAFLLSEKLLGEVRSYIDENYVEEHSCRRRLLDVENNVLNGKTVLKQRKQEAHYDRPCSDRSDRSESAVEPYGNSADPLEELIGRLDEPFHAALLRLIDAKGKTDVEVYKKANIDRKLFSKIRTGKGYTPGKRTILALAIALELSLKETNDLLERAGYALSHSRKFDVIVEFFIVSGKYDIFQINEVLFQYGQPLLGAG